MEDPAGGDDETYIACAAHLTELVAELAPPGLTAPGPVDRLAPQPGVSQADVGTGGAHLVGDDPRPMSRAENPAAHAEPEGRLGQGGDGQEADHDQVAAPAPTPNHRIRAVVEKATPMAWAKRLGGPATGRAGPSRGATTRVAS